ncbi:MAG TPA: methionine--tRNA ligase [Polyangiaceae bacterium]|nr:methionine--tRNA ligase [Polyangiaceae bacterium]
MNERRILVTHALPYANGPIHIGHLVESVQTDIWVRFQRMRGRQVRFFCADDTHGAPIMISARKQGITELELIDRVNAAHQKDYAGFGIEFDNFGSTHSEENRRLCAEFWQRLKAAGCIAEHSVSQLFDVKEQMFLADRFVKGTCPRCGAKDQYGDNCEKCGATYNPTDLIDPVSTLSGTKPELREAKHLFVELEREHAFLDQWTASEGTLQPEIASYLQNFFLNNPLRDWDVSRPAPYFGFEIPDSPGNYWYVWFDAPIGYLASTAQWCAKNGSDLNDWWRSDDTDIYHFIGKDIVYFHCLFWPMMLKAAGFKQPKHIHVHGFLTVNGEKMSKSRGTNIPASLYLEFLDPEALRYYYASKLGPGTDDLNLDLEEFPQRVNSTLLAKVINLASRSARFVEQVGLSAEYPDDGGLFAQFKAARAEIEQAYDAFDSAKAMRIIMALADRANEYTDRMQPWTLAKQPEKAKDVQDVCTVCLNLFRQLMVYLTPVVPRLSERTEAIYGLRITSFDDVDSPLVGRAVGKFTHLMQRVDPKQALALLEASAKLAAADAAPAEASAPAPSADDDAALLAEPLAPECSIDDFTRVDLRVARVLNAEPVKEAKKLLKLTVTLGGNNTRTIFAGIKAAYEPEKLIGRLVVVVANLKPRQMKFGLSEGMVIAAGPGEAEVFVLAPDSGAKPGQRVH